jgi:putative copper export protein
MYTSLLIFFVTGIYLMFADLNYLGVGNFHNPWSVLMLVKHILILGMIGMGFWFNAILRVGPLMSSNTGAEQALIRFRQYSNLMAITGILVLLLTAIAQVQ